MKRRTKLVHFSKEHHSTLKLGHQILRDSESNHQEAIEQHKDEFLAHFQAEEIQFQPYWALLNQADLQLRFEQDHQKLRELLNHCDDSDTWVEFAQVLIDHTRFEERELFPAFEVFL